MIYRLVLIPLVALATLIGTAGPANSARASHTEVTVMANGWYAIAIIERGVVTAHVLTAAEWARDQKPGGPLSATFKNIGAPGGYPTKAAAQKAVTAFNAQPNPKKLDQGGVPTAPDPSVPGLGGIAAIGQFFDRLTEGNTWVRIGEVVLGLALIIVGTAKLFSTTAVGKTAAKVAKVGMLA
jgi:hypothetical protein